MQASSPHALRVTSRTFGSKTWCSGGPNNVGCTRKSCGLARQKWFDKRRGEIRKFERNGSQLNACMHWCRQAVRMNCVLLHVLLPAKTWRADTEATIGEKLLALLFLFDKLRSSQVSTSSAHPGFTVLRALVPVPVHVPVGDHYS